MLNGKTSAQQPFDDLCPADVRLAHRLLFAASGTPLRSAAPVSSAAPSTAQVVTSDSKNKWLCDPVVLDDAMRGLLGIDRTVPLLICVDELRNLGAKPALGEISVAAVAAATGSRPEGATYVIASALSAVGPMKCATKRRPVYWMPLPPLALAQWDAALQQHGPAECVVTGSQDARTPRVATSASSRQANPTCFAPVPFAPKARNFGGAAG